MISPSLANQSGKRRLFRIKVTVFLTKETVAVTAIQPGSAVTSAKELLWLILNYSLISVSKQPFFPDSVIHNYEVIPPAEQEENEQKMILLLT